MKHTTIRVPDDEHRALSVLAKKNLRSFNAELLLAIRGHLAKEASR